MELVIDLIVQYSWQAVVVAVLAMLLVECIKPLIRKFISNNRIRHTLYWLLGYAVSFGLSAAQSAILGRFDEWFTLFGSSAVVISILAPVASNTGFWDWIEGIVGDIFSKASETSSWKKAIKALAQSFGVDSSTLDTIATKVEEEYKTLIEGDAVSFFSEYADELIMNIKQKLAGFVDNDKLQSAAESLFTSLKESWVGSESTEVSKEG